MELANSFKGFGRIGHRVQPYVSALENQAWDTAEIEEFQR